MEVNDMHMLTVSPDTVRASEVGSFGAQDQ